MFIKDLQDAMGPYIGPASFYSLIAPICREATLDKQNGKPWTLDRFVTKLQMQVPVYFDCPPERTTNLTRNLVSAVSSKFHFYLES